MGFQKLVNIIKFQRRAAETNCCVNYSGVTSWRQHCTSLGNTTVSAQLVVFGLLGVHRTSRDKNNAPYPSCWGQAS